MHVRPSRQHVLYPVSSHIYEGNAFAAVIRNVERFFFSDQLPCRLINRSFHLIYDKYLHTYRKAYCNFVITSISFNVIPSLRSLEMLLHASGMLV